MGVTCRNYTKARRHPKVMGRLPGGKPLPVPITMPQLGAFACSAIVVAVLCLVFKLTDLGPIPTVLVAATVILVPFVAVRHLRPDQRGALAHLRAMTLDRANERMESRR